jgi:L-serine dehydratase
MRPDGCCCAASTTLIGGGFVVSDEELQRMKGARAPDAAQRRAVSRSHRQGDAGYGGRSGLSIAEMKRANEETKMSRAELDAGLDRVWGAMLGLHRARIEPGRHHAGRAEGEAPGARSLNDKLARSEWSRNRPNPLLANDWLSIYAMAVNEENAAGGSVVTAPTNGAAGVVPAVLRYWLHFYPEADRGLDPRLPADGGGRRRHHQDTMPRSRARKSAARARSARPRRWPRPGSAPSWAATPEQVENAAEIALEHHLGMTCDPVGGSRAGALHRAQRAGRGQGRHRRLAGHQGRRHATSCRSTRRSRPCARPGST